MGVMPWEAKTIVEARRQFVAHARRPDANIRGLCRAFNISANTAYKLLKRFQVEGEKSLHDRSRRPRHIPSRSSEETERAILSVRADHPTWGARKIAKQLRLLGAPVVPAPSTITAILARHGRIGWPDPVSTAKWMSALQHGGIESPDVPRGLVDHPDLPLLLDRLQNGRLRDRKRSMVILATRRGLRGTLVCKVLNISPAAYRRCLRVFEVCGASALFARRINPHRKFDSEVVKKALFAVLHQPPKSFGINRTTWKMADLSRVLRETGQPAGEDVIRKIIKMAGYRWRRAQVVLTSNDPEFSQKLGHIRSILSRLEADVVYLIFYYINGYFLYFLFPYLNVFRESLVCLHDNLYLQTVLKLLIFFKENVFYMPCYSPQYSRSLIFSFLIFGGRLKHGCP
jgi:transposase